MSRYGRFSSQSRSRSSDSSAGWFRNSPAPAPATSDAEKSLRELAITTFGNDVQFRDVKAPQPVSCGSEEPEFEDDDLEPIAAPSM